MFGKTKKRYSLDKTLQGYGRHAVKSQRLRISERLNRQSCEMISTLDFKAINFGEESGSLVFTIGEHQRWQDMVQESKTYNNIFTWYCHQRH